ncbi:MAG: hypothetical protein AAF518_20640 [Spirochaetota bacterium]
MEKQLFAIYFRLFTMEATVKKDPYKKFRRKIKIPTSKQIQPKKGKGSYKRNEKHRGRIPSDSSLLFA